MSEIALGRIAPSFDLPVLYPVSLDLAETPEAQTPRAKVTGGGERRVKSADLLGTPYLLYFYPRASTPGCTTQACALRDARAEGRLTLADSKIADGKTFLPIFGVSPDPLPKLARFSAKERLNFPLLSDQDHTLAEAYGVWGEKKLYGRVSMGITRSSFLVSGEGVICAANRKVRAAAHRDWVEEALNAFEALSGSIQPANAAKRK